MESRAKLFGHPAHQMLVVFPLGLLATAVIFDVLRLPTGNSTLAVVAYHLMAAGLLGGLVAAPFGWIDWFAIPGGTRAKRVGFAHGMTNSAVMIVFFLAWFLRREDPTAPSGLSTGLALAGVALALLGGWLGGELVTRLGVGVARGAHLNAPNSLSGRPAAEGATEG
jgi:uncharacterized membrane protein